MAELVISIRSSLAPVIQRYASLCLHLCKETDRASQCKPDALEDIGSACAELADRLDPRIHGLDVFRAEIEKLVAETLRSQTKDPLS